MSGYGEPPVERDSSSGEPGASPDASGNEGGGVGFAAIPDRPAEPPTSANPTDPPPAGSEPAPAAPYNPMAPMSPPDRPKKSPVRLVAVFLAVVGAALGALFVKFVLPLVLVGVAGQVFDTAFGGPYMRLPADVRSGFEQRLEAVLGDTMKDQSETEQTATILTLVKGGLPRLDDGLVNSNFSLTAKAIGATDLASCAAVSRAVIAGTDPPESAATAMIGTLSDADLQQWFEIRVAAIEAQVRGTPDQLDISDEEVAPLYDKLFEIMSPADIQTIGLLASGQTVEDEALCAAVRGLYASVLTLSAEDATLFARFDVSP